MTLSMISYYLGLSTARTSSRCSARCGLLGGHYFITSPSAHDQGVGPPGDNKVFFEAQTLSLVMYLWEDSRNMDGLIRERYTCTACR